MDVHPDVFNDGGSFPDADPPSEPEDDLVDKRTAAELYYNNHGNNMKKIIAMAIGLKKDNTDDALVDVVKEPWASENMEDDPVRSERRDHPAGGE
jgi:hypothetical protein